MKVILLEKYRKLGEVGSVVDVKGGYARNFLIPNNKAVRATKDNIADFEAKKAELIKQSEKKEAEAKKIAEKISEKIVPIIKQAGDDGRLYGSVTTSEISEELNKLAGTEISRKQITVNTAIKFLGFYQVVVDLGESVIADIFVNVSRTESEAKEIEEEFKKGKIGLGPLKTQEEGNKKSTPEAEKNEEEGKEEAQSEEAANDDAEKTAESAESAEEKEEAKAE